MLTRRRFLVGGLLALVSALAAACAAAIGSSLPACRAGDRSTRRNRRILALKSVA